MDKAGVAARISSHLRREAISGAGAADMPPVWLRVRRLLRLPDEQFVSGMFSVLFGREPEPAGLEANLDALRQGVSRAELIRSLATSSEALSRSGDPGWLREVEYLTPEGVREGVAEILDRPAEAFVRGAFRVLLGRPPEPRETIRALSLLADGRSRDRLLRLLAASGEHLERGVDAAWMDALPLAARADLRDALADARGAADPDFVANLFRAFFNRSPDPADLTHHLDLLAGGMPREDWAVAVAGSPEARENGIDPEWVRDELDALRRTDGNAGPRRAASGPPRSLPALRAIPERAEFVRAAYRAAVGREASPAEVRRGVRQLRWLPFLVTRPRFVRSLLDSTEAYLAGRRALYEVRDDVPARLDRQGRALSRDLDRLWDAGEYGVAVAQSLAQRTGEVRDGVERVLWQLEPLGSAGAADSPGGSDSPGGAGGSGESLWKLARGLVDAERTLRERADAQSRHADGRDADAGRDGRSGGRDGGSDGERPRGDRQAGREVPRQDRQQDRQRDRQDGGAACAS